MHLMWRKSLYGIQQTESWRYVLYILPKIPEMSNRLSGANLEHVKQPNKTKLLTTRRVSSFMQGKGVSGISSTLHKLQTLINATLMPSLFLSDSSFFSSAIC
jgi:hypothetical protein